MKPLDINSQNISQFGYAGIFHQQDGSYYIDIECIFCEDKMVTVLESYDLLDFLDDGNAGIRLSNVKFLHAVIKDDTLKIILKDFDSGKLHHRTHCLNDSTIPCDWLLIEKDYFNDDLLDFEF